MKLLQISVRSREILSGASFIPVSVVGLNTSSTSDTAGLQQVVSLICADYKIGTWQLAGEVLRL